MILTWLTKFINQSQRNTPEQPQLSYRQLQIVMLGLVPLQAWKCAWLAWPTASQQASCQKSYPTQNPPTPSRRRACGTCVANSFTPACPRTSETIVTSPATVNSLHRKPWNHGFYRAHSRCTITGSPEHMVSIGPTAGDLSPLTPCRGSPEHMVSIGPTAGALSPLTPCQGSPEHMVSRGPTAGTLSTLIKHGLPPQLKPWFS